MDNFSRIHLLPASPWPGGGADELLTVFLDHNLLAALAATALEELLPRSSTTALQEAVGAEAFSFLWLVGDGHMFS